MTRNQGDERDLVLHVEDVTEPHDGVRVLTLRDAAGADLPRWDPGAHVDLRLSEDLVRQYSLCGDPADSAAWRIAVLREPESRGGSSWVHDTLVAGDEVPARGPRNHFPLVEAERYVFVAGGIGITPLLPMIETVASAGAEWRLEYGGRSRTSMLGADQLVDRHGDRVGLHPQDEVGMLDLATLLADLDDETHVYCCGPTGLLAAVESRCADTPHLLHLEHFSPAEPIVTEGDEGFDVELSDSSVTLHVPADRTVLSVLEEAGVAPLSSCTEGTCGTCETGVLSGEVDHRDSLLTQDEQDANDVMFVCVSRARHGCARLVLEL